MRKQLRSALGIAVATVVGLTGCKSLEVANPNAPNFGTAFSDPGALTGLVVGGFRNWINTRESHDGSLVLHTMADSYTASWNNFNIRFYSSQGAECPQRCGWDNTPTSTFRFEIETLWYGYNAPLSQAYDVLNAIRNLGAVIEDEDETKKWEALAVMLQGMSLSGLALNFDRAFVFDETDDLSTIDKIKQLEFADRAVVRDAAIEKFNSAVTLLQAGPQFTTPSALTGVVNGPTYTSAQLIKIIRTMQAELLAHYPRNAAENAAVNWDQVSTFAAQGMSSGTPHGFEFYQDRTILISGDKDWGNQSTTVQIDTRLAKLITTNHQDPWPAPDGNPPPISPDARVGDGSWGPEDDILFSGTTAATANAGTDFAYHPFIFFQAARGLYHFGELSHIRYSYAASPGYGLPGEDGTGVVPLYSPAVNDLLWAEALLRKPAQNKAQAAQLINNTRVGRGHLTPLTGAESVADMLTAVQYEQEIEMLGLGAMPFYNRRRIDGLWPMSPRQMPVPARDLAQIQVEFYSFGGPGNPAGLAPGTGGLTARPMNVRDKWKELFARAKTEARRSNRH
ncbi:MAG: hypothetical protein HOP28_14410 [Gemmatimonadales bacterium]|nr:hypothetical protein [Gemmatimonadales bacterium]